MDVSLIIGWVLGFALIIYGIGMEKLVNFLDMPSVIIVVGGTMAALIASFPFKTLAQIPKHIGIMISSNRYNFGRRYSYPGRYGENGQKKGAFGFGRAGFYHQRSFSETKRYADCRRHGCGEDQRDAGE